MSYRVSRAVALPAGAYGLAGSRIAFLRRVYGLFTASIAVSAAGALVALYGGVESSQAVVRVGGALVKVPPFVAFFGNHPFVALGITLAAVFGASFVRHRRGVNVAALFGMAAILGVVLAPALFWAQIRAGVGGTLSASPVRDAFLLATAAFGGLTAYAIVSRRDFSFLRGALMMGFFVVLGAALLNLFFQSTVFGLAISSVGVLLFGAYVLYDTSRLLRSGENDAVGGAIQLYLDFVNIFLSLLNILSSRRD